MAQPIPRTHTYDWQAPITHWEDRRKLDGKTYLQNILDGEQIVSPMIQTMGIELDAVDDGRVVCTVEPTEYHYNLIGTVHGGLAATLFDTALAFSIITQLPAGQVCATVQLNVQYLRPITLQTGKVRCEANAIRVGRTMGTAEAKIIGENDGKVYGHASAICVIMPAPTGDLNLIEAAATRTFTWEDPLYYTQQAMQLSGIDSLRAMMKGDLPPPPIVMATGISSIERIDVGDVRFGNDVRPWQMNTAGTMHGGMIATLCDSALGCAVQSTLPQGTGYTTVELNMNFVRPITADVPKIYADATLLHGGNRLATAQSQVVDDTGRLYAHATTTCLVFSLNDR